MKSIKKTFCSILCFVMSIIFSSCEKDVTDDISLANSTPKLVIDGGLERNMTTPLNVQQIRLTTTNNFLSQEANPAVTDAIVTISDGIDTWSFDHQGGGWYVNSDLIPELETTYTIDILWNDEHYSGSDVLSEVPVFDNFFYEFKEETIFSSGGYFIKFDSTDPLGVDNYYYNRLYKNGEFIIKPDPGNSYNLISSDEFFDGQKREAVNVNGEIPFEVGETATGQQLSISKAYFDYLFDLFIQTGNTGISFGGNPPPATIRSNVINTTDPSHRVVGFFYTVDIEEASIQIEE